MYCVLFSTTVCFPFTFLFARLFYTYFCLLSLNVCFFSFFLTFQLLLYVLHFNCYTKHIRIFSKEKRSSSGNSNRKKSSNCKNGFGCFSSSLMHVSFVQCSMFISFLSRLTKANILNIYRWLIIFRSSLCVHNGPKAERTKNVIKKYTHTRTTFRFAVFR